MQFLETVKSLKLQRTVALGCCLIMSLSFFLMSIRRPIFYLSTTDGVVIPDLDHSAHDQDLFLRSFVHQRFQGGDLTPFFAPDIKLASSVVPYRITEIIPDPKQNTISLRVLVGPSMQKTLIRVALEGKRPMKSHPFRFWIVGLVEEQES